MNYPKARSLIEANLAADFAAVRSDTRAEDTAASDAAIANIEAWFNAPVVRWRSLPLAEFSGWLEMRGTLYEDTAASANPSAQKLSRILSGRSRLEAFDMSDANVRQRVSGVLSGLVMAGVWTQDDADAAIALAKESVPRWQDEGIGRPVGRGVILLLRSGRK